MCFASILSPKLLTYAFVAIGLVFAGVYGDSQPGQGVFFGLGGYCMAMYPSSRRRVSPIPDPVDAGHSDFMDWNQITQLPFFWKPFHSFPFYDPCDHPGAGVLFPHHRRRDVQAPCRWRIFRDHHPGGRGHSDDPDRRAAGYTGGINGITDLRTLHGWDIRTDHAKFILYFVEVVLLFGCIGAAQFIRLTKLGRILVAMREQKIASASPATASQFQDLRFLRGGDLCLDRRRDVHAGGRFHVAVFVGIVPSIEMVIYTAVGGRMSIFGAIYGTLLVNFAKNQPVGIVPATLAVSASARCSSPWCWRFRMACQESEGSRSAPRRRLMSSRKPKSGNGWTDGSVADGAPAE